VSFTTELHSAIDQFFPTKLIKIVVQNPLTVAVVRRVSSSSTEICGKSAIKHHSEMPPKKNTKSSHETVFESSSNSEGNMASASMNLEEFFDRRMKQQSGVPEQRGQLPPLPKQCGGGTGATGCPFSPELRFEICALFT
jgi:hypothetical protein